MGRIWVDGVEGAGIPADDPGVLLGLTVFETMRTYGSRVFRLERHLDRLERSAAELDISPPPRAAIRREITARAEVDSRIRYTLTAGGHRVVDVRPIDVERVRHPMRVATLEWEPPTYLPGAVKHGSRAGWIIAARRLGVDEVILVDRGGRLLEANRSNLFAVRDGIIMTPPLDGRFLAGVTRGALIDGARRAGLELNEVPLQRDAAYDELYLSSTLKQLAPVIQIDGAPGPGAGPLGTALISAFESLVAEEVAQRREDPER